MNRTVYQNNTLNNCFFFLFCLGKGLGSLIGGFLMKAFGTRPTYQIFAVLSLITGLVYFLFNSFYLKKRPQVEGNDIVKKKPKEKPVENGIESAIERIENSKEQQHQQKQENNKNTKDILKGEENLGFENSKAMELRQTNKDKNHESIECVPEVKVSEKESNINSTKQCEKIHGNTIVGVMNPAFENEPNKCSVTVETEPKQSSKQEVNENH